MAIPLPIAFAVLTLFEETQVFEPAIRLNAQGESAGTVLIGKQPLPGQRQLRVRVPAGSSLWLNGIKQTRTEEGDFDLNDPLPVTVTAVPPAPVELRITPRVYVSKQTFRRSGRKLHGRIWVRNSLENTVNVFVTVTGEGVKLETTATVPPGLTQLVEVEGSAPEGPASLSLSTVLEKEEEAMDVGYRFVVRPNVEVPKS